MPILTLKVVTVQSSMDAYRFYSKHVSNVSDDQGVLLTCLKPIAMPGSRWVAWVP